MRKEGVCMGEFDGKTVLVTGGASGIGSFAAAAFAERGARVCIAGRREDRLAETLGALRFEGGAGMYAVCDVSDEGEVSHMMAEVLDRFGRVDIVVNSAGTSGQFAVGNAEAGFDEWRREVDVNLNGCAYVCGAAIPSMLERGWGRIVNIASVNAFLASKTVPRHPYNASKAGVCGLTRGISSTYASAGITVNALCPGLFETEMTQGFFSNSFALSTFNRQIPAGRPGRPDEIVGPILFLASESASYVTGQCIAVDGGMATGSFI